MRISSSLVIEQYIDNKVSKSIAKNNDMQNQNNTSYKNNTKNLKKEIEKYEHHELQYTNIVKESKEIYDKYFDKSSDKNIMNIENYINANYETSSVITNSSNSTINNSVETNSNTLKSADSTELIQNMQGFINDYNSLIDKVRSVLSEGRYSDKVDIKKENDEENFKVILGLRKKQESNENKLRKFIEEIQNALFTTVNEMGRKINEVGIKVSKEKPNLNLELDENKYKRAIEENSRNMYRLLIGFEENQEEGLIRRLKDTFKKYSGGYNSVFASGISNPKQNNSIYFEDIRKQEEEIKDLMSRMKKKEDELSSKFSMLQSNLSKHGEQVESLDY